jgi:hypothetical protein
LAVAAVVALGHPVRRRPRRLSRALVGEWATFDSVDGAAFTPAEPT